ncbi:MAG: replication endonuclease [Halopseudomonas sp.]
MSSVLTTALENSGLVRIDQKWVTKRVGLFPLSWQSKIGADYVHIWEAKSFRDANSRLRELADQMYLAGTGLLASSTHEIVKRYADIISKRLEKDFFDLLRRTDDQDFVINKIIEEVESRGLVFPLDYTVYCTKDQKIAALARVFKANWWARKIRRLQAKKLEQVARDMRIVHRHKQVYCSDISVCNRREQKRRNARMIEGLEVVSDEGDVLSLAECVEASVANPENRRSELMVRMRGFEDVANLAGHQGVFITLTTPSKFHAVHSSGHSNGKYQGANPREAQDYLCGVWAKVRAAWKRQSIEPYGFRVAEPHHDGTPHWHLILFIEPTQLDAAISTFQEYAVAEDLNELRNGVQARFDTKLIDPNKGSATGYIAKYISKNINGYGIDEDHESGREAQDSAVRVEAWASLWGIRQFQQIGGPQVSIWRELRRVSEEEASELFKQSGHEQPESIEQARAAADASNWAAFVMLMGGPTCKRADQPLQLHKEIRRTETGEWEENEYGEIISRVRGVIDRVKGKVAMLLTRRKQWSVRRAEHDSAPQVAPWSSVNNCTRENNTGDLRRKRGQGLAYH